MVLRVLLFAAFFFHSCVSAEKSEENASIDPARLYTIHCASCHKPDGTGGVSGAKNLTSSQLSTDEIANVITQGQGDMMPFQDILNKNEIDSLSSFVFELRKK